MKLFKLLKNIKCRVLGSMLVDVLGLYHKDSDVKQGGMFFCLKGEKNNGEKFVMSAINNGAKVVVLESEIKGLVGVTQVLVKDARVAMSLIAINFYNNPAKKLKLIGVTGTNGKTTTSYMAAGLLSGLDKKVAIIGTNGVVYGEKTIETGMTTPDPIELQKILAMLVGENFKYVCMEVSAHAIHLKKLEGLTFEVMIFSNLTEDHLDFFQNMDSYFEAKAKIFTRKYVKKAIINIDDEYGKKLFEGINVDKISYSIYNNSDKKAENLGLESFMQKFKLGNEIITSKYLGEFNVYNLISAICCLEGLNLKVINPQILIEKLNPVPGRFNSVVIKQKLFVIDYAHTPDGLENVLRLCKRIAGCNKLISVFGCGGDRETQKRSKMGEISSKIADFSIITTDNPRFEEREKIAEDIELGVVGDNYKIILERAEAIKYSDKISKEGDVILIAGKGCENYIDEKGKKIYYSDLEQVEKLRG